MLIAGTSKVQTKGFKLNRVGGKGKKKRGGGEGGFVYQDKHTKCQQLSVENFATVSFKCIEITFQSSLGWLKKIWQCSQTFIKETELTPSCRSSP